jgi:preprotein translocase subunit YajC
VHRQTLARVVDDNGAQVETGEDTTPAAAAPSMELNGEPVYGERADDQAQVDAAKRKSED